MNNELNLNLDEIKVDTEKITVAETPGIDVEINDGNSNIIDEDDIKICDKKSPIVMLFGPPTSGKSMTLVRLARYLRKQGYTVKADSTFKSSRVYKDRCDTFHKNLNTTEALPGNPFDEFLLVKIIHHGKTVCQILEAPGEHYFNPKNPEDIDVHNFRPYLTEMTRNLTNRKIWVFLAEAQWNVHSTIKEAYVSRIRNCKHQLIKRNDDVVILYNKVDQKGELFEDAKLHLSAAEQAMKDEYEGLSSVFKNNNPITSLWRESNYRFVPFCSGYFTKQGGGGKRFNESEERYPRHLWDELRSCFNG